MTTKAMAPVFLCLVAGCAAMGGGPAATSSEPPQAKVTELFSRDLKDLPGNKEGLMITGGYSTVIIKPSLLPGRSFRSLEKSSVTFACGGSDDVAAGPPPIAAQPATRHRKTGAIALVVMVHFPVAASSAEP